MNDNKVTLLGFFFFLVCIALIGGIYFLNRQLTQLHEDLSELERRRGELTRTTQSLIEQKKVFSDAFRVLEGYSVKRHAFLLRGSRSGPGNQRGQYPFHATTRRFKR